MAAALADPLLTQQGLVSSQASALYSSSSGRLTCLITWPSHLDNARGKGLTFQTALCVVRPRGYTVSATDAQGPTTHIVSALLHRSLCARHTSPWLLSLSLSRRRVGRLCTAGARGGNGNSKHSLSPHGARTFATRS